MRYSSEIDIFYESVFICGNTEEETFTMLNEMMSKKVVKNESVSSLSQKNWI